MNQGFDESTPSEQEVILELPDDERVREALRRELSNGGGVKEGISGEEWLAFKRRQEEGPDLRVFYRHEIIRSLLDSGRVSSTELQASLDEIQRSYGDELDKELFAAVFSAVKTNVEVMLGKRSR